MTTINLKDFYPWYTHDEYLSLIHISIVGRMRSSRFLPPFHTLHISIIAYNEGVAL